MKTDFGLLNNFHPPHVYKSIVYYVSQAFYDMMILLGGDMSRFEIIRDFPGETIINTETKIL